MDNSSFAIAYLYEYNLLDVILQPSKYNSNSKYNFDNLFLMTANLYILGEYILQNKKIFDIELNSENLNKIDFGLLLLTVCFRNMQVKFGKENTTINKLILRETFKTANEYIKENQIMNENFDELIALINSNNYERLSVGKLLRKIHYKNIIKMLIVGICYDYINEVKLEMLISEINDNTLNPIILKYQEFFNYIVKENLLHVDALKPLFNGQEIIELLKIKPGKEIGKLLELLIDEQIKDQNMDKEKSVVFLGKKKEEILLDQNNNNLNKDKNSHKKKNKKGK